MPKETMSPRERWEAVLERRKPDRVPMDYWATSEATEKLMCHLGVSTMDELCDRLHIDMPVKVYPRYDGPALSSGTDVFGLKYRDVTHDGGIYQEAINNPIAAYDSVEEIERNYTWPTADFYDFSVIPAQVKGNEDRPIQGGGSEPFLVYKLLRGEEQAFVDLIANPEIVDYCLGKLFDFAYETTRRSLETIPG